MSSITEQFVLQEVFSKITQLADECAHHLPTTSLRTSKALSHHQAAEQQKNLNKFISHCKQGLETLIHHGILSKDTIDLEKLPVLLYQISAKKNLKNTLQVEMGISDETLLHCYSHAKMMFEKAHYQDAQNIFFLLTFLQPTIASFWIGLGFTEEKLQNHHSAVFAFLMALEVDGENLEPALFCAENLIILKEKEHAEALLDQVLEKIKHTQKFYALKEHAEKLKRGLQS